MSDRGKKENRHFHIFIFIVFLFFTGKQARPAGERPGFGGDKSPSGYAQTSLPDKMFLQRVYQSRHAPQPAWSGRDTRMPFDCAYRTVLAGDILFFGSSADNKFYALDEASGAERWTYFTDAPIRLAPVVWKDYVYVASDDGFLYCLSARDGKLVWKLRGGPADSRVLGNERMISRWPARGGPVIADGVLYFAAGIWPSEGIYLYALDAETGRILWCNDSSGSIFMPQPHTGSDALSGVSAQGSLVICGDVLLVPTGRAVPAAFSRRDGTFLYFHLQKYGSGGSGRGGSDIGAADPYFFNNGFLFDSKTGHAKYEGDRNTIFAASPKYLILARDDGEIMAVDRSNLWMRVKTIDRKGKTVESDVFTTPVWRIKVSQKTFYSLIVTDNAVVAGSPGCVSALEIPSGREILKAKVEGIPYSLSAANSKIYASTDKGMIYFFSGKERAQPEIIGPGAIVSPSPEERVYTRAAEEIIEETGMTEGYCLDLLCGDGSLAYALAKRTSLRIYATDPDPENVIRARLKLDRAGLYGVRATVHQDDPSQTRYPDFFANLVVSGRAVKEGPDIVPEKERLRMQRPYGGAACLGIPGAMTISVRGELEGAGIWTHQYANAANTNCSDDRILKGPLGVLWFADFGFQMPNRHGRGHAPLFKEGMLVVEGLDALLGVDAYNGRPLWTFPLKDVLKPYNQEHLVGTAFTNSNMCIDGDSVFLRTEAQCFRISLGSGQKMQEYMIPQEAGGADSEWGYIACEKGILYGSCSNKDHIVKYLFLKADMSDIFTESRNLFALDVNTGGMKWIYQAKNSIRHNAIAVGSGRVYVIDRPLEEQDISGVDERRGKTAEKKQDNPTPARLLCIDADTGKILWEKAEDIYGTMLALSPKQDVLIMGYQYSQRDFQLPSEKGDRLTGIRATDGARLWEARDKYISRPVIIDRQVYTQPYARDIATGTRKEDFFLDDRAPCGCGTISGSQNLLLYRSGTLGYTDLLTDRGTENYGGIRPGCWINVIPAGGLVLMPDATDLCRCSYLIKASIALAPYGVRQPEFSAESRSFNKPAVVKLSADAGAIDIRYTIDGADPTISSNLYKDGIEISKSMTVKARAFQAGFPPSRASTAEFLVDSHIIPLEGDSWEVYDSPGAIPEKSRWRLKDGSMKEVSNIFVSVEGNDPQKERPGTLRIYKQGRDFKDGELQLDICSLDNDTFGVAFRLASPEKYYLWAMDEQRKFHVLACKNGESYTVLSSANKGYEPGRWYRLRIMLKGSRIQIDLDDEREFDIQDETFPQGSFAFYAWGCLGASYRNVLWEEGIISKEKTR